MTGLLAASDSGGGNFLVSPELGLMIWALLAFGITALGWITLPIAIAFFMLEVGLIATLQAFIFATLTSIYFGEASAGGH